LGPTKVILPEFKQGVWNTMEKGSTRPALPYDCTCFAEGTPFEKEFLKIVF